MSLLHHQAVRSAEQAESEKRTWSLSPFPDFIESLANIFKSRGLAVTAANLSDSNADPSAFAAFAFAVWNTLPADVMRDKPKKIRAFSGHVSTALMGWRARQIK